MNIEKWENKMIAALEGTLDEVEKNNLLTSIESNEALQDLWNSYNAMYESMSIMPTDFPSKNLSTRFNVMLDTEVKRNNSRSSAKIISPNFLRSVAAVAAIFTGVYFIWSVQSTNQSIEKHLVEVNDQLEEMMLHHSPTERIKAIRVNHSATTGQGTNKAVIETLLKVLLTDRSSNVRLAAVQTLSSYTVNPEVRAGLIKSLSIEEDGAVKHAIVICLGSISSDETKETLENLINDHSQEKYVKDEAHLQLIKYQRIKL